MRLADAEDVERLVDLMTDFYAESGYVLDHSHAEEAFTALLADPRLGRIWLIQRGSEDVGYVVITFVFGMEYGGPMAVVDDFYVSPVSRNAGIGTAAPCGGAPVLRPPRSAGHVRGGRTRERGRSVGVSSYGLRKDRSAVDDSAPGRSHACGVAATRRPVRP